MERARIDRAIEKAFGKLEIDAFKPGWKYAAETAYHDGRIFVPRDDTGVSLAHAILHHAFELARSGALGGEMEEDVIETVLIHLTLGAAEEWATTRYGETLQRAIALAEKMAERLPSSEGIRSAESPRAAPSLRKTTRSRHKA